MEDTALGPDVVCGVEVCVVLDIHTDSALREMPCKICPIVPLCDGTNL